ALAARIRAALAARQPEASPLVREHIDWALAQDRAAEARAS
ncbi:tRNA epoxyqueuosine(34) reductase QueG, partial [Cupriavidus sp. 2MCAB6]